MTKIKFPIIIGALLLAANVNSQPLHHFIYEELSLPPYQLFINDISSDGSTVVGTAYNGILDIWAWKKVKGFEIEILPVPQQFITEGEAKAVSKDGRVIVGSVALDIIGGPYVGNVAIIWHDDGNLIEIFEKHRSNYPNSRATVVSEDGTIVAGYVSSRLGSPNVFVWYEATNTFTILDQIGGPNNLGSFVTDMSADGKTIIGYNLGPIVAPTITHWVVYLQ